MSDQELERLIATLTGNEPAELRTYLSVPHEGRPLIIGSTAPAVLPTVLEPSRSSDLLVPVGSGPKPIDFAGSYLTSDEYIQLSIGGVPVSVEMLIEHFAAAYSREVTLINLALLNSLLPRNSKMEELFAEFRLLLTDDLRAKLDAAMSAPHRGYHKVVAARQPVLSAIRRVITMDEVTTPTESMPALAAALMLSHAVASTLNADPSPPEEEILGVSAHLAVELVQVSFLNQSRDIYASISRTLRLWREYGPRLRTYRPRDEPAALLATATGLEIEDLLAMGFALLAHSMAWEPGKPPYLRPDFGSEMERSTLDAFASLISSSFDELRSSFSGLDSRFDFTPIQSRPVLIADAGFLVLDPTFLWERVTSGLYWYVHDQERALGDSLRLSWTQAYSEMVELMVEDQLRRMSPIVIGSHERGETFYTEEDFDRAYEGKKCDAAIHFGSAVVLFEVVSGQMTTLTRIEGSRDQLFKDTKKLVIKKCRQLDAAAMDVLADESKLTGLPSAAGIRVLPIVVVTEGFPLNSLTSALIQHLLSEENLLSDARLTSVGIIDLEDLDFLEGLLEAGHSPLDILSAWREGSLADASLQTYLSSVPEFGDIARPAAMVRQTGEIFKDLIGRLRLRPEQGKGTEGPTGS